RGGAQPLLLLQLDTERGELAQQLPERVELDVDQIGHTCLPAAATGAAWADLVTTLAARTLAVAATLAAALESYRAVDGGVAGQLGGGRVPVPQ
uniref:hypothetical protein n=1 Tax=Modestobacter sp. KNN46-3 TaxID=2711218 RepID=UPI0013DF3099